MAEKFDPLFTNKVHTDVEALTGKYNELSNYFDIMTNQIDSEVNKYPYTNGEREDRSEEDVIGQENVDLNYQMETAINILRTGLNDIFQDILLMCGLKDIDSLEQLIEQDDELRDEDVSQKLLELVYLYKIIDTGIAVDAVSRLQQLRPDYFTGPETENVWSAVKLLNEEFFDYCNAIDEFVERLEQKSK